MWVTAGETAGPSALPPLLVRHAAMCIAHAIWPRSRRALLSTLEFFASYFELRMSMTHWLYFTAMNDVVPAGIARALVETHLPAEYQAKHTWQYVTKLLNSAARGDADVGDAEIALRLVLAMEGIPCRPR